MGNSVFTLGKFWFPETCPEGAADGKCVRSLHYEPEQLFRIEVYTTLVWGNSRDEVLIFEKDDLDLNTDVFEHKVNITLPKNRDQ